MVKEEDMAETGCMELEGETIGKEAEMYVVMVVEGIEMEEEEGIEMILEISVGLDPEVTQEEDVREAHPDVKEVQRGMTEVQREGYKQQERQAFRECSEKPGGLA